MELPHRSAMWWQHSRSAGVIVAPGRTHAMAGVTAHSRAIVRSANARILVTSLMSVTLPLTSTNRLLTTNTMLSLLADKGCDSDHSPSEQLRFGGRSPARPSIVIHCSAPDYPDLSRRTPFDAQRRRWSSSFQELDIQSRRRRERQPIHVSRGE
jgi:hypothetical protein